MSVHSIGSIDVKGQRLVIRADLNAPMKDGVVSDATRITRFAEGLKPLLAQGDLDSVWVKLLALLDVNFAAGELDELQVVRARLVDREGRGESQAFVHRQPDRGPIAVAGSGRPPRVEIGRVG